MVTVLFGVGLVVTLALLVSINHKLAHLAPRLWAMTREERARDDARAQAVLQEAAAAKVGAITASLRQYEEQLHAAFRTQIAAAQMRARMVESHSAEAAATLTAARGLLRELRRLIDDRCAGSRKRAESTAAEVEDTRETIEIPAPPAGTAPDEPDDEPTKVGLPRVTDAEVSNGLRLPPRAGAARRDAGRGETR